MKTIQEVKEQVAKDMGFVDFDNAMKAYGEMLLREAAERASLKVEYQDCGFNDVEVDKQSILSIIDEMK